MEWGPSELPVHNILIILKHFIQACSCFSHLIPFYFSFVAIQKHVGETKRECLECVTTGRGNSKRDSWGGVRRGEKLSPIGSYSIRNTPRTLHCDLFSFAGNYMLPAKLIRKIRSRIIFTGVQYALQHGLGTKFSSVISF